MSVKERWHGTKQITFHTDEAISLIVPLLKDDPNIIIAYLFGSRIISSAICASDIDIAFYTTKNFLWKDYYILYGELTKKVYSDRLDLIWLNRAEPILSFEIIKNSTVLFYKDEDILNDFELKVKKNFYDYSLYLRRHKGYG